MTYPTSSFSVLVEISYHTDVFKFLGRELGSGHSRERAHLKPFSKDAFIKRVVRKKNYLYKLC